MDGVHDMGGMHGFGKVEPEQDEPVFHDDWEARTFALYRQLPALVIGGGEIDLRRKPLLRRPHEIDQQRARIV